VAGSRRGLFRLKCTNLTGSTWRIKKNLPRVRGWEFDTGICRFRMMYATHSRRHSCTAVGYGFFSRQDPWNVFKGPVPSVRIQWPWCLLSLWQKWVYFVFGATTPSGRGPSHSRGFYITHNNAPQSVALLWTCDQLVAETSDNTQHS